MNRADYAAVLKEVEGELTEQNGTFMDMFGKKSEKELKEALYIAAIALMAADRLYSNITKQEFDSIKDA